MNPAACKSPALRAGASAVSAAFARSAGVSFAVESKCALTGTYVCIGSAGIASGSSGASFASASDSATARASDSSVRSLVTTTACFGP